MRLIARTVVSYTGIMALPPCHMFCQFYVDTDKGELSCQMYQVTFMKMDPVC